MPETLLSHQTLGGKADLDYDQQVTGLVPTLYIGLGGTGRNVLLRFRKSLFDHYGSARPKCCRFLVIDTDEQQKDKVDVGAKSQDAFAPARLLADQGEFIGCNVAERQYNAVLSAFEERNDRRYKTWLHPNFRRLVPPTNMVQGAGTYRQAGRLAFFMKQPSIRDQITRHLEQMFHEASLPNVEIFPGRPGTIAPNSLEVIIITSLAGGTGSGTFIDCAYLVQDILASNRIHALNNVAAHVTLAAYMPTIFSRKYPALGRRFQQNAYAALLEMEHYCTYRPDEAFGDRHQTTTGLGGEFRVNWSDPTGPENRIRRRPWDTCYLIDNVNDRQPGKIPEADDLYQMFADYLFLDFGDTPFAVAKRSTRSNHRQLLDKIIRSSVLADFTDERERRFADVFENRYGSTFSSIGMAEVIIDRDRINRAASYRLAVQLLTQRWISTADQFREQQYGAWAKSDLVDGDPPEGTTERVSLTPENLWPWLFSADDADWLERLESALNKLVASDDYGKLPDFLSSFTRSLQKAASGTGNSPRDTLEQKLLDAIGRGDPGRLKLRLEQLLKTRRQKLGTAPAKELLTAYQKELDKFQDRLKVWQKELSGLPNDQTLLARHRDALGVGFPCRGFAVRKTFEWAVEDARKVLRNRFRSTALEPLQQIYASLSSWVGHAQAKLDGVKPTLYARVAETQSFLEEVRGKLEEQYQHFAKHAGNDLKISLLTEWNDTEYDREINRALIGNRDVGQGTSPTVFDWNRAEQAILNRLLNAPGIRAQSLPELVAEWMRQKHDQHDTLDAIVMQIYTACRETLGEGIDLAEVAHGNVVNYLASRPLDQRQRVAQQLVLAAAPYLPAAQLDWIEGFTPNCHNILGCSGGDDPSGAANVEMTKKLVNDLSVANVPNIEVERVHETKEFWPTRMVLIRELAGIPLCYYSRLPELENAYFDPQLEEQRKTCHIRYNETYEDLPDILLVETVTEGEERQYLQIRENVDYVFRGLFLGFIERQPDGMFCVRIYSEALGELPIALGTRINRIVKHACVKEDVRDHLRAAWNRWRQQRATPKHFAVLYNALQQSRDLIQASNRTQASLPVLNCIVRLLNSTKIDLEMTDEGRRWFELLRTHHKDADHETFENWQQIWYPTVCKQIREACLTLIDPDLMPIYQIDQKKIDAVVFPEFS